MKREEPFRQIEPDTLDGVALWRIGRQGNQGDVVWNGERVGSVPSGAIEDHDGVFVGRQGLGELGEEQGHGDRGHRGQDQGEFGAGGGFDGSEDMGPIEPLVAQAGRPLALHPPAMAGPSFLADAGFVLEEQAEALAGMGLGGGRQGFAEPFF